jgi:hypothetical protein
MRQNGRKSAASLAVVSTDIRGISRLGAPASLKHEAERAVWMATVNARPANWFGPEHAPLLANYCRHVVGADVIAGQLDEMSPASLREDEGIARFERLRRLLHAETRSLHMLARAMRLTHQSMYEKETAAATAGKGTGRPWARD